MIPEIEKIRSLGLANILPVSHKGFYLNGFNDAYAATLKHLAGSEGDVEKIAEHYYRICNPDGMVEHDKVCLIDDIQKHTAIHTAQLLLKVQELEAAANAVLQHLPSLDALPNKTETEIGNNTKALYKALGKL